MKTLTLDVETTGLPPKGAVYETDFLSFPRIVTLAYKVDQQETKYFIINQNGVPIPPEATAIHGITDAMCGASPHFLANCLAMMVAEGFEAKVCIGHNIYFDSSTIKANVLRLIKEGAVGADFYLTIAELLHKDRRVDTMMKTISFCALPGKYGHKWPKLTELHMKLFNEPFNAHNSKDDVDATHKCYVELRRLGVL